MAAGHVMPKLQGMESADQLMPVSELALWFVALPRISLAGTTAFGFTTPIVIR